MYLRGKGVPQDYSEALLWIRKAADHGDARAQSALGYMYYNGEGVAQDYAEAVHWYRKAAEQGDPLAQQGLGYMYANRRGVPHDDTQAVAWYRKAAEQGDAEAQQSLGYMYASGRGVPPDYGEAVRWYRKAADQGNAKAKHALEMLERRSTPPARTRYFEISLAFVSFLLGLWCLLGSLGFLLSGRKPRDWRQLAITLLGIAFLLNSALSFYVFSHDIRYSPYHDAFHAARRLLVATALLIFVTVVLPAKKKPNALPG
jgi:TPR repeat protein